MNSTTLLTFLASLLLASCSSMGKEPESFGDGTNDGAVASRGLDSAQIDREIILGKRLIDSAVDPIYSSGDVALMQKAREHFRLLSAERSRQSLVRYYMSYCDYHCCLALQRFESDDAEDFLDRAIETLEEIVEQDERFAEGWGLLSSCYGLKAGTGMMSGMKYGPKSGRAVKVALKLEPENPRVQLVHGIGKYYTPEAYGGSKEEALTILRKAALLFDAAKPAETVYPNWGHTETYTYIGICMTDFGDTIAARQAFERVLAINPEYGWVKYELLPKLSGGNK